MKRPGSTFRLFTSAAVAALLAASCVVESADDDDDFVCEDGETRDCTCGDLEGTQTCSTGRTRFNACVCEGGGEGGAGGSPSDGGSTSVAGEAGSAGQSGGSGGDAGSAGSAGSAGAAGEGGAGGGGGVCADPLDPCETCVFARCCAEYNACLEGTETCGNEYADIQACIDEERMTFGIGPSIVGPCAAGVSPSGMISGLDPRTQALLNCMGGGAGWSMFSDWPAASCEVGCFDLYQP